MTSASEAIVHNEKGSETCDLTEINSDRTALTHNVVSNHYSLVVTRASRAPETYIFLTYIFEILKWSNQRILIFSMRILSHRGHFGKSPENITNFSLIKCLNLKRYAKTTYWLF